MDTKTIDAGFVGLTRSYLGEKVEVVRRYPSGRPNRFVVRESGSGELLECPRSNSTRGVPVDSGYQSIKVIGKTRRANVYDPDQLQYRVSFAVQALLSKSESATSSRKFDTCFEMNDGDKVKAEILRRAEKNPKLAKGLLFHNFWVEEVIQAECNRLTASYPEIVGLKFDFTGSDSVFPQIMIEQKAGDGGIGTHFSPVVDFHRLGNVERSVLESAAMALKRMVDRKYCSQREFSFPKAA